MARYKGERFASNYKFFLQPLTSIHLRSHTKVELGENSYISYSYALSAVAFLILIISCINFMNLSTARAVRRSKEVGLRKVIGASRTQLLIQFLGESIFLSFIALLFAIVLAELFLPLFNSLVDKHLVIDFSKNLFLYIGLILITFFVGCVSGSYPAIFLSSFTPLDALKSSLKKGSVAGVLLRKGLVLLQFAISLIFIIGTILILRQMNFIGNKDLGFDKDYVISTRSLGKLQKRHNVIKVELLQNPNISDITASQLATPGTYAGLPMAYVPEGKGKDEQITLYLSAVDYNFFDFFGIDIVKGRNFSKEITSDVGCLILNESAARQIGGESAIGKRIIDEGWGVDGTVIGVVEDFHNVSLHEEIKPSVFELNPQRCQFFFIRIRPENIKETIFFLEEKIHEFSPYFPFWYSFLDDSIVASYRQEKRVSQVFVISSILSIIIACLGLLGLVSFSVERRTKEIGIRKVLGASISRIVQLLTIEFTKLVILANVIAWPIAYYAMNRWLQGFSYRINIGLWTFLLAGALAFVIALLTVSFKAIKAARANPVESLRYE